GWAIPGWGFDDLLPYFRKSEDQSRGADPWHGVGGPLAVSDLPRHELCDAFIASAVALGIPRNDDFNGAAQEGTGYYQATASRGRRCSTAVGYLRPAEKRPNLKVEVDALATRIHFRDRRTVGIEFQKEGEIHTVRAGEIILCGGAFNSPQLLQLSGVGPRALLERHGIPVVHESPGVGADLQDHFYVRTFWRCRKAITLNDDMMSLRRMALVGRIVNTAPMRDYVNAEYLPGPGVQGDSEWLDYCRGMGETVFHPTSTCRIGAVVDEKLKVKGLRGLRVIDASVMPAVPSGNINAAVIAIAEKGADLVKEDA